MSCTVRGVSREGLWNACSGVWEMFWVVVDLGYEGVICKFDSAACRYCMSARAQQYWEVCVGARWFGIWGNGRGESLKGVCSVRSR